MVVVALASLASLAVSMSLVCVRRATVTADPRIGVIIVVLVGSTVFPITATATGDIDDIAGLTWLSLFLFVVAGILHFVVGRSFNYIAVQMLGASRTTVIVTTYPIFALPLAIPIFDERFTVLTGIGVALVVAGPILMTQGEARMSPRITGAANEAPKQLATGIVSAIGAAAFLGLSFVLVKGALNETNEPVLGTMISYLAALIYVIGYAMVRPGSSSLVGLSKSAFTWFLAAALLVALSQISRYFALSAGDVTVVVVVMQTVPLIVFALTFLMNRSIEALNGLIIIGSILVVLGTSLVVWQS